MTMYPMEVSTNSISFANCAPGLRPPLSDSGRCTRTESSCRKRQAPAPARPSVSCPQSRSAAPALSGRHSTGCLRSCPSTTRGWRSGRGLLRTKRLRGLYTRQRNHSRVHLRRIIVIQARTTRPRRKRIRSVLVDPGCVSASRMDHAKYRVRPYEVPGIHRRAARSRVPNPGRSRSWYRSEPQTECMALQPARFPWWSPAHRATSHARHRSKAPLFSATLRKPEPRARERNPIA